MQIGNFLLFLQPQSMKYMSNPYFQFKQFTIRHDKCAMKVGTDSVLLGAWAPVKGKTALDVGCGTGILSLMLACRSDLHMIHAIDIDPAAVDQTLENASNTKWRQRITAETVDVRSFSPSCAFDTVISNPPFYTETVLPPSQGRLHARNTVSLDYRQLVDSVVRFLSPQGIFSVVLPAAAEMTFRGLLVEYGLHPVQSLLITTVEGKAPKRVLLASSPAVQPVSEKRELMCIHRSDGTFSHEYTELAGRYYLHL